MRLGPVLLLLLLVPNASGQANMTLTVYIPYDNATGRPLNDEPAIVGAFAAARPQLTSTSLPQASITYMAQATTLPEARVTYPTPSETSTTSTTVAEDEPAIIGAQAGYDTGESSKGIWDWLTDILKELF